MLKMASSLDSVEEWRRLQGRVRTQGYRDRQNEDARGRRRQSDRDRRRAARQRATEARWRPQEPPEESSVCITVRFNRKFSSRMLLCVCALFDRATRLSRLRLRAVQLRFQTTHTTLSGLHLAHTFVLQSAWSTLHVSLRKASQRMGMSSSTIVLQLKGSEAKWSNPQGPLTLK